MSTSSDAGHEVEVKKDYSLDKVPREDRQMSWLSITNITFGIATAITDCKNRLHRRSAPSEGLFPIIYERASRCVKNLIPRFSARKKRT
ncbi:hypothetical protein GIW82_12855 [Planomicrobium sp. YIM 101495]|nr:hypothetical protein [Planomicrobium sp. YIM 101495]